MPFTNSYHSFIVICSLSSFCYCPDIGVVLLILAGIILQIFLLAHLQRTWMILVIIIGELLLEHSRIVTIVLIAHC